jgi:hypothetical protein
VHPHQCLEEELVRQFARLRPFGAHGDGLAENGLDLRFVVLLHPLQNRRDVVMLQSRLGGEDDGAIHCIAVAKCAR